MVCVRKNINIILLVILSWKIQNQQFAKQENSNIPVIQGTISRLVVTKLMDEIVHPSLYVNWCGSNVDTDASLANGIFLGCTIWNSEKVHWASSLPTYACICIKYAYSHMHTDIDIPFVCGNNSKWSA